MPAHIKPNPSYHSIAIYIIFALLLSIGLMNLYSAGNEDLYFKAQLRHSAVSLCLFCLVAWVIPIRVINMYTYLIWGFISTCLLLVLVLGHSAGGAQRWIILGPLRFQPSEIAKITTALLVAKYFYNRQARYSYRPLELWRLLFGILVTFVLIFKQPDFGTAGICLLIAMIQLLFVRIEITRKTILSVLASSTLLAFVGWTHLLRPYQKLRILTLLYPNLDPSGSGYNSLQSLVAVGSGRHFGKGFMQGTQTQLQFLPARHTDFIFSVFAEEQGFWGCLFIFFLFTYLAYLGLRIAKDARDTYSALAAIGIAALIFIEYFLNIAMVLGMFPVVGMPLPFFSYGGSALLTVSLALGLLVAIDRDSTKNIRANRLEIT